tara:strand:+ start:8283 stop:9245 length:963 start_codon:yes stop_codon:yes gene_type:complete
MLITSNIIRSATRTPDSRLKCVSFCRENEKYLSLLSRCDCDIYVIRQDGLSDWKETIVPSPEGLFILGKDLSDCNIPFFDLVICNGRLQEFDVAASLAASLHVPLVTVDHVSKKVFQKLPLHATVSPPVSLEPRVGQINVALSDGIKNSWETSTYGISITIPTTVDNRFFERRKKKEDFLLDNNIPQEIMAYIQGPVNEFGCSPRFHPEKPKDPLDFKFYINTWNNIDNKTLEAMAAGCISLSPRTPETERIITHGENGLLFSDIPSLKALMEGCKNGKYAEVGDRARKYVSNTCVDEETFIKKWKQVFSYASNSFFMRN